VPITTVKNYEQKNTAASGKLIKAVYASYVYVDPLEGIPVPKHVEDF
jgi:hypothetical protein